jgi:hypothetical protein
MSDQIAVNQITDREILGALRSVTTAAIECRHCLITAAKTANASDIVAGFVETIDNTIAESVAVQKRMARRGKLL